MDETSGSAGATPDHKELGPWTKFATSIRKVDFTMGAILQCDGMGGRAVLHSRAQGQHGGEQQPRAGLPRVRSGVWLSPGCATLFMASASLR